MGEVVKLEKVVKVYSIGSNLFYALRGVDLSVREGDFVAVMGPSGSGKTTLLNMIGLLDRPTSGKVFIDGIDTSRVSDRELAYIRNYKIGFVFQLFNLVNRLTVLENIEMPLVVRGIPKKKRVEMAVEALLKVGGDISWLYKKPQQLSGGQQQRVAIARAIVGRPKILLADEPTGNLDRSSAKTVMNVFLELSKLGHTIITVTHDPEVANCTNRIYYLRDGSIVRVEDPQPERCIINTV